MDTKKQKELLDMYFDGRASRNNMKKLAQELNTPGFGKTFMEEQWDNAEATMNAFVRERIFENIKEDIKPRRSYHFKKWLQAAAIIIAVVSTSLSVYLYYNEKMPADMTFKVEKGQKASMTLSDGTRVWLNSGTTVTYGKKFNDEERVVSLDGEAYFEVAHNAEAPFVVDCNGLYVRALGTSFNIKSYHDDQNIQTSLINGKVEISDKSKKLILTPNQSLSYNRYSHKMIKSDEDDCGQFAEWRNNQLYFDSQSFSDIVLTLERNYNVKFVFKSESLKKYRYTGTVGNTSIDSMLQLFSMTSPLVYHINGNTIYLDENPDTKAIFEDMIQSKQ